MAVESKPLFHPEFLRQQVRSFNLPEQTGAWQPTLQHWAGLIPSRRADDFKETALLPELLTDISCGLLGYTGPVGPADTHNSHNSHNSHLSGTGQAASANTFTFSRERHVEVDGKVADAALGRIPRGFMVHLTAEEWGGAKEPVRSGAARRPQTSRVRLPNSGEAVERYN